MTMTTVARWTKRCGNGDECVCRGSAGGNAAYIPDDVQICDPCLLAESGLTCGTYDRCNDPLGMVTLYSEEDVIQALRRATGR